MGLVSDESPAPERDGNVESTNETGRLLHKCPNCETVYLHDQPHQCSNCDRLTVSVSDEYDPPSK